MTIPDSRRRSQSSTYRDLGCSWLKEEGERRWTFGHRRNVKDFQEEVWAHIRQARGSCYRTTLGPLHGYPLYTWVLSLLRSLLVCQNSMECRKGHLYLYAPCSLAFHRERIEVLCNFWTKLVFPHKLGVGIVRTRPKCRRCRFTSHIRSRPCQKSDFRC